MERRRMNLKKEQDFTLKNCQSIVSSNQIEIMEGKGENPLVLFPAKFPVTRRRRGRDMCEIPQDLVIEILMTLPTKSLMRFKCLSKQWSSLISSRYFCDRVFTVTQPPRLYMCLVDDDGQRELLAISSNKTCFVVERIQGIGGFFLSGLGGLMCFTVRKKACIYNPTIKQLLTLPAIKFDIKAEEGENIRYYVGHDPVKNEYKVFCTNVISSGLLNKLKAEHWVLVLEAGGCWKKVVSNHPHVPFSLGRSITTGSVLHYMAWLDVDTCAVVSFDFRSEGLTTTPISWEVGNVPPRLVRMRAELIEFGGKIAVFDHSSLREKGLVYLWVLKDKKWSKKMSQVLEPCQRHLVNDIELIVKGTTQDGRVILAPLEMSSSPFYIMCYDMQSNDLRKFEIKGVPHCWFDKSCYFDLKVMDDKIDKVVYLDF